MAQDAQSPRVAVFVDYRFRQDGAGITVERAFALFLFALAPRLAHLTLVGRLDPTPEPYPYAVPESVGFCGLPHYDSLRNPVKAFVPLLRGMKRCWRALDDVDCVWALGPNPLAIVTAVFGLLRRRRVVLGVRQDTRAYVRSRHPNRRIMWWAADLMDGAFHLLSRACPVVVVGDDIARNYPHAKAVHVLHVSLVSEADVLDDDPPARAEFQRRLMTVGRLDTEKNPLLLADVLAALNNNGSPPWTLDVYGDGPLAAELEQRSTELGLGDAIRLHGYVRNDDGLFDAYRSADAFLHVSWTEGMPQVLLEAFAARLPTVATSVGGVPGLVGDAALLVEPGDGPAAASALQRVAEDAELRHELADKAEAVVRDHTIERETEKIAALLSGR